MTKAHTIFAVAALVAAAWHLSGCSNAHHPLDGARAGSSGSRSSAARGGAGGSDPGAKDDTSGDGPGGAEDGGGTDPGGGPGDDAGSFGIGPDGGTLSAAGAELVVPAGAVSEKTTFSISVLLSEYPELEADYELRSDVIAVEPHGLSFSEPVSLALPYTGDTVSELLMITANPGGTWSTVEGASFEEGMARAELTHFSLIAIVAKKPYLGYCRVTSKTDDTIGNQLTRWQYTYDSEGRLSKMEQFAVVNGFSGIQNTLVIGGSSYTMVREDWHDGDISWATFKGGASSDVFDGYPDWVMWTHTEDNVTRETNENYFLYDSRGRVTQVKLFTPTPGGNVVELDIGYDDQDNATSLHYWFYTGPTDVNSYFSATYDDKPSPYANIPHFFHVLPEGWQFGDSGPLFMALSQHNVLSYIDARGGTGTYSYEYDSHGLPTHRVLHYTATNGATSGYSEWYTYACP